MLRRTILVMVAMALGAGCGTQLSQVPYQESETTTPALPTVTTPPEPDSSIANGGDSPASQTDQAQDSTVGVWVTLKMTTFLHREPRSPSLSLRELPAGTGISVSSYSRGYFGVTVGKDEGFVYGYVVEFQQGGDVRVRLDSLSGEGKKRDATEDAKIQEVWRKAEDREIEAETKAFQKELSRQAAEALAIQQQIARERAQRLRRKYVNQVIAQNIIDRQIWVGMTEAMARDSRGEPSRVNRSGTAAGISEQWIYGNHYLYFDNGILTSWQEWGR